MAPLATLRRAVLAWVLTLLAWGVAVAGAPPADLPRFAPASDTETHPAGWRALTFPKIPRHTRYHLEREGDGWVLRADSEAAASALYRTLHVDPRAYPVLSWRWKVAGVIAGADARTRRGDDYAARVYVAFRFEPGQATLWERTRYGLYRAIYGEYPPAVVLNYVWDNRLPAGTMLDNAYTDRAKMIVVRSGDADAGRWIAERRDVRADYRRLVGDEPPAIVGVAVMTDTDDTGSRATAWYDAIRLSPP